MTSQEQHYEERAAIFEYDAGMNRAVAESLAFLYVYGEAAIYKLNEQEWYEERAAIFEYDAGMSRAKAESLAHDIAFNNGELFHADRQTLSDSGSDSASRREEHHFNGRDQREELAACF